MYKIIIAGDGRVLSAATGDSAITGAVEVDTLPDGNIHDYRYVDGAYVHDPLPAPPPLPGPVDLVAENQLLRAQVQALADRGEFVEDCIAEMAMQVYGGV